MAREIDRGEIPAHMKTIGIIGGLGPQATIDFEAFLHKAAQDIIPQKENRGYPPVVSIYVRNAPMDLSKMPKAFIPDKRLLDAARKIGKISDFLVIPSNTPHFFKEAIERASGKKILSIVDVTLEEVKRRRNKRVGVLAIGVTLNKRLYQDPLEELGIGWESIQEELAVDLDKAIFGVMEGKDPQEINSPAIKAIDYLRGKNVESIILGCTELPLLLGKQVNSPDLINPSKLLAEAAVKFAISK